MPYQATTPVSQQLGVLHIGSNPSDRPAVGGLHHHFRHDRCRSTRTLPDRNRQAFLAAGAAFTAVSLQSHTTTATSIPIGPLGVRGPASSARSHPFHGSCAPGESLDLELTGLRHPRRLDQLRRHSSR